MAKLSFVVLCVVAVGVARAADITAEEKEAIKTALQPIVAECSKEHGVSRDEIEAAKDAKDPQNLNQCFLGCVLKKIKILNDNGEYDAEAGFGKIKEYLKDGSQFEGIAKDCAKVNDAAVSDGAAGCERAKLLIACVLEHKAEIPL